MFEWNQPEPEYQTSEYATCNKRWKRAPSVHPVEITDLLNYEAQKKHHKNKILGDKVAQILKQNTDLSDKIAEEYQTPLEKLKKDPIMALVTKTVSTYMFLRHNRDRKTKTQTEDFSWGEPFFKKEWERKLQPPQETKLKKWKWKQKREPLPVRKAKFRKWE